MIVPYAHVDTLAALDEPTLTEMMMLAQRSQAVLEERMRPQGFNLGVNQGRAAGAGIADHLHVHLLPRWVGDTNFMPALGDVRVMPQHLDETYALLVGGFAE
jgi:ATP adenylyltransferase